MIREQQGTPSRSPSGAAPAARGSSARTCGFRFHGSRACSPAGRSSYSCPRTKFVELPFRPPSAWPWSLTQASSASRAPRERPACAEARSPAWISSAAASHRSAQVRTRPRSPSSGSSVRGLVSRPATTRPRRTAPPASRLRFKSAGTDSVDVSLTARSTSHGMFARAATVAKATDSRSTTTGSADERPWLDTFAAERASRRALSSAVSAMRVADRRAGPRRWSPARVDVRRDPRREEASGLVEDVLAE